MRFYYLSVFSWALYGAYCVLALMLFSVLWKRLLKLKLSNPLYATFVAAILITPWIEELMIARNFDQLCSKDAGVFINKSVQVDGFYDDTTGWGPRQLSETQYRFIESKDVLSKKLLRVERADDVTRARALKWYAEKNPGQEPSKELFVVYALDEAHQIAVAPNGVDAYRVSVIDKPAARYQYRTVHSHKPVAHKVKRFEDVVVDSQTGEVLGRYTNYSRGAYWFFISLGAPTVPCKETEAATRKYGTLIYRAVLKPLEMTSK